MASKLNNWTHRDLNFLSRVTLVKVILQTIPSYVFSVMAAPKGILKKIRAIQRNFLWGSTEIKMKWALVDWETIYHPKRAGGLGLRDLEITNQVLNAKIWWQWVTHKREPWANLWQQKYAKGWPSQNLICLNQDIPRSSIWQVANANRQLVREHSFWAIGNGEEEKFFRDSWQQLPKIQEEVVLPIL